jgi:hypothetical protein
MTEAGATDSVVNTPGAVIVRIAVAEAVPDFAVNVAFVVVVTAEVVIANVALVAPAATVTEVGTAALVLLDVKVTTRPPVGAGPSSAMVPVEVSVPGTVVGDTVNPANPTEGEIVSVVVADAVPIFAVIVDVAAVVTVVVVAVKLTVDEPAGTVTVAGTVALVLLDERLTDTPPEPAGPVSVTVPVEGFPPTTTAGAIDTLRSPAGVIVRVATAD